jgi:hypothetical protein
MIATGLVLIAVSIEGADQDGSAVPSCLIRNENTGHN